MRFFLALVAAFTLVLSGCSEKKVVMTDPSFDKVKSAGVLVMGFVGGFPPMTFVDADSNVVGFDVDLATEVCLRLGIKLKTQRISWTDKEVELNSGNIDCVWSGMSIDSTRKFTMNLSDPYLSNRMVYIVKNKDLSDLDSLMGKKIAVQKASTAQPLLESSEIGKSAKAIAVFDEIDGARNALENDSVDAVFMDEVVAKYWNFAYGKEYLILGDALLDEFYAVGFRKKDQALRDTVNSVLASMKKDGKFLEISAKWFGK